MDVKFPFNRCHQRVVTVGCAFHDYYPLAETLPINRCHQQVVTNYNSEFYGLQDGWVSNQKVSPASGDI